MRRHPHPCFSRFALRDVVQTTTCRSNREKPSWERHLTSLATKAGEKCGLAIMLVPRRNQHHVSFCSNGSSVGRIRTPWYNLYTFLIPLSIRKISYSPNKLPTLVFIFSVRAIITSCFESRVRAHRPNAAIPLRPRFIHVHKNNFYGHIVLTPRSHRHIIEIYRQR